MPVITTDLVLYPAVNIPQDDVSTAGGARGTTAVTGASPGEILPRLKANLTGTLDNTPDLQIQYQKAFWKNTNGTSNLLVPRLFLANGLARPASAGLIFIVLTNASDAAKKVKYWPNVSGLITPDSINTPTAVGTVNATSGALTCNWVERAWLVDGTSGAQVAAAGDVQIWCGTSIGSAVLLGVIPGPPPEGGTGESWATAEVQMGGIASTDDTGTSTNRRTAPGGVTFSRAYTYAAGIVPRLDTTNDTIGPGISQGFWIKQTLQPTMPAADNVQYAWRIQGQTSQ